MRHVARRYAAAFGTRDLATAWIVAWVRAPSAERSALPAMDRGRWGLMPALPLPDATLRAVAAYVWSLQEADAADPRAAGEGGRGMGHGGHPHGPPGGPGSGGVCGTGGHGGGPPPG